MKKVFIYSPILCLVILLLESCSKDKSYNSEDDKKYSELLTKTSKLEEENKIDSAFYFINSYSINSETPLYYQNKSKLELSRLYQKQGDFIESEAIIVSILQNNTDSLLEPNIHNDLGIVYKEQKQFEKSLQHYSIAKEKSLSELHKAIINNNVGVVYLEEEKYTNAISVLSPLLVNSSLKEYPFFYVKAIDNLGYAYLNIDKLKIADSLLHRGYFIRDSINDSQGKVASTIHLSKLFLKQKDTLNAISSAKEAYYISTSIKNPDDRLEALDLLIRLDTNSDWYKIYHSLQDSISTVRQNHKYQFAKIRYDEVKALEQVNKEKNQKVILTITILVLLLIGVLLFRIFKLKNKKEQLRTIYNTETKISKKVHDELANDIFQTLSFVEIDENSDSNFKNNLLDKLDKIYAKSRNISRENNSIKTDKEYIEELTNLINGFNTNSTQIITKGIKNINWIKIKEEQKITIYRVLQELLINMKKHSKASLVLISFETKTSIIEIIFKDNGIGIEALKMKNGLANVETRIKDISGKCTFESDNGFKVLINIPI